MSQNPNETPPSPETPADPLDALRQELEAARTQAAEHKDKYLRALAEADNTRRRAELDVAGAHKYAIERLAGEIITVRDSLDLAASVDLDGENRDGLAKMQEGIALTLKQLDDVFRKFGIAVLDPRGEKFDPSRHQAISMVESAEVPANHVLSVFQKGYQLHDRVLRPAMVVVARAPAQNG
jgi:molecular chaperone GrpE